VRIVAVQIRDGAVWVDLAPPADPCACHRDRPRDALGRWSRGTWPAGATLHA
jgi:hypothetical protein